MTAKRNARIQDILGLINSAWPAGLAEDWDNVGLQVGDPAEPVSRVALALDPVEATIEKAISEKADLLLCHHPLIFKPLSRLTPGDETGRLAIKAIRKGLAVASVHTNLDRANDGLNDWLVELLGIKQAEPLENAEGQLFKIAVFVPTDHQDAVAAALFEAGAGQVGEYDQCSFRLDGTGTFRPGAETNPFIGERGQVENVSEVRLETIVPKERLARAVSRMEKAHPYEEVAYDIYPLSNTRQDVGLGRIGRLDDAVSLAELADTVKRQLAAEYLRVVGPAERTISKVAVCGGSGASLLSLAARRGADVLITGDVKYHEARIAESLDMALIDAGHFATEKIMIDNMTRRLGELVEKKGLEVELVPLDIEQEPFKLF